MEVSYVPENCFGATTKEELDRFVGAMSLMRLTKGIGTPNDGALNKEFLLDTHKKIFTDIYPWAGKIRNASEEVAAMGQVLCRSTFVPTFLDSVMDDIARAQPASKEEAVKELAHQWGELTMVHPFRDGNTRSQSVFFTKLAEQWGCPFDWEKLRLNEMKAARYSAALSGDARYLVHAISRGVEGMTPPNNQEELRYLEGMKPGVLYHQMREWIAQYPDREPYPRELLTQAKRIDPLSS